MAKDEPYANLHHGHKLFACAVEINRGLFATKKALDQGLAPFFCMGFGCGGRI